MIGHKTLPGAAALRNAWFIVLIALGTSGCIDDPGKSDGTRAANAAPSIQIVPNEVSVMAGGTLRVTPSASDPDGDPLSFRIFGKPAWTRFDPGTGALTGTPADSDVGSYDGIVIEVSDGVNRVRAPSLRLVVQASTSSVGGGSVSPPPPPPNNPPQISGVPATAVVEGQAYSFTPSASDPDGQSLTFSIQNMPGWASFSTSTGRLSGTPGTGTAATYGNIIMSVSDGSLSASLPAFSITVQQIANGSATLSWSPPTLRTDGTPLSNLAGYRIHYGNAAGEYSSKITINSAGITTYVVENLGPGTWYFVTTAFDSTGAESDYSNVASKKIS